MGRAGGCGPASAGGRLTLTLTLTLTDGAGRRTGSHSTGYCSPLTVFTSSCIFTGGDTCGAVDFGAVPGGRRGGGDGTFSLRRIKIVSAPWSAVIHSVTYLPPSLSLRHPSAMAASSARESSAPAAAAASPGSGSAAGTRRASLEADPPEAWRGANEAVRDLHRNLHQIELESGAFSPARSTPPQSSAEANAANRVVQQSRTVHEWDVSAARYRLYPEIGTVRQGTLPNPRRAGASQTRSHSDARASRWAGVRPGQAGRLPPRLRHRQ